MGLSQSGDPVHAGAQRQVPTERSAVSSRDRHEEPLGYARSERC
jgi:hypothetical protein